MIDQVLETVLYAADLDAADRFYGGVLGLACTSRRPGLFLFYRLRHAMLLIFNPDAALKGRDVPSHGARGPGHVCFALDAPAIETLARRLEEHGTAVEQWQTWPGGARSLYLRDPAGNSVEFAPPSIWGLTQAVSRD